MRRELSDVAHMRVGGSPSRWQMLSTRVVLPWMLEARTASTYSEKTTSARRTRRLVVMP